MASKKPHTGSVFLQFCDAALEFASVPLAKLIVDPKYQRTEYHAGPRIRKIAKNFNPLTAGAFRVFRRAGGMYAESNGGSRTAALRLRYPDGVYENGTPVMVVVQILPGSGIRTEASDMLKSNTGVLAFTANHAFKAELACGKKIEREIVAVLKLVGIELVFDHGRQAGNRTNSAGTFRRAYDLAGKLNFDRMLQILATYQRPDFSGQYERDALRPDFILALAKLLRDLKLPYTHANVFRGLKQGLPAKDIYAIRSEQLTDHSGGEARRNALLKAITESIDIGLGKRSAKGRKAS